MRQGRRIDDWRGVLLATARHVVLTVPFGFTKVFACITMPSCVSLSVQKLCLRLGPHLQHDSPTDPPSGGEAAAGGVTSAVDCARQIRV